MLRSKIVHRPCLSGRQASSIVHRLSVCFFLLAISHMQLAICSFAQGEFKYDAKEKRNPFIPLITSEGRLLKLDKEEAHGNLAVQGIVYDKQGRSYAIVNDSVVAIGDNIGDYRVWKIEQNKVIFIKDGQAMEIELKKEE